MTIENPKEELIAAFFDIDGTLTSERTWKGYVNYFRKNGKLRWTYLSFIIYHYSLYLLHRIGFISIANFRGQWAANLAWFLRNQKPENTISLWEWTVTYLRPFIRKDTHSILEEHLRSGDIVLLVSSAPQPMVERIAQELGTTHAIGTKPEIIRGHYTGRSLEPICIGNNKASMALEYLEAHHLRIDLSKSYAYADSITDLPLLELTGFPVVVYPDATLLNEAKQRAWQIYPK
jgi:HAD superfamily hydrolase (TIGR01490 family)